MCLWAHETVCTCADYSKLGACNQSLAQKQKGAKLNTEEDLIV